MSEKFMKSYLLKVISFVFLFSNLVQAGDVGSSGLSFLRFGIGARPAGMGEAFVGFSGDISSIYYNPAGLSDLKNTEFTFMHNQWFQDASLEHFSLATNWKKNTLGLIFTISQISNLELREGPTTEPLGSFDAHDLVLGISFARKERENLGIGATFKLLYERIYTSSVTGFSIDAGLLYYIREDWKIGFAISDIGQPMGYEEESFSLPAQYKLGTSCLKKMEKIKGNLGIGFDLVKPNDSKLKIHTGVEYNYNQIASLRLGYQLGYDEKSISFGFGVNYKKYSLDYAFVPYSSNLGNSHRFSLNLKL
jgi:hypothetical protein